MLRNLLRGLDSIAADDDEFVTVGPVDLASGHENLRHQQMTTKGNRFVGDFMTARAFSKRADAILFPNYFTPPWIYGSTRVGTVIHDLNYRYFPGQFNTRKRLWLRAAHRQTLHRADDIVAISNFVKEDILRFHSDRWRDKVSVIPNPISWDRFEPRSQGFRRLPEIYVLAVAAAYPHKNLATLVRAFSLLSPRHNEAHLVIAGQVGSRLVGVSTTSKIAGLVESLGLEHRVVELGHVTDGDLGHLYRRATAFAFPSLFEGFGMPPVEALGFGLPVVTTTAAAIPETTLGQAIYVSDPTDPRELATVIDEVLLDPDRYRPREPGVIRRHYAPDRIARLYYEVLTK